jgi:hypothetical protein
MAEGLAKLIIEVVTGALFVVILAWARLRFARRRHRGASGGFLPASVPVRLRGRGAQYAGVFRYGRLELATASWRPGMGWGNPVTLAGITRISSRPAGRLDAGLPQPSLRDDVVLFGLDQNQLTVQLAVHPADVELVRQCLVRHRARPVPAPSVIKGRQRLQLLVPTSTIAILVIGTLWLGLMVALIPKDDLRSSFGVSFLIASAVAVCALAAMFAIRQAWHKRRL